MSFLTMDVEKIKRIVRDSLGLDEDVEIDDNVPISCLADDVDRADMVDILFRAGVYNHDDFSCGELNEQGRSFMYNAGWFARRNGCGNIYLRDSSRRDMKTIIGTLTSLEIGIMSEYRKEIAT